MSELVSRLPHEENCHNRSSFTTHSKISNTPCREKKHHSSDTEGRLRHGYDIRNETHSILK